MTKTRSCRICGAQASRADLAHGAEAAICRQCVAAGIPATLASVSAVSDGEALPRSFLLCDLCGEHTPPAALYQP
ncbi:MAG TPA: hypothetical protein VJU61_14200, partial [Polyangiaceae bacterium]|nr:hypothetical protein [Polyangiaceae bacterium]